MYVLIFIYSVCHPLRDAVVELLVTQPRKCVTELNAHLQKTTWSYKQLVLE